MQCYACLQGSCRHFEVFFFPLFFAIGCEFVSEIIQRCILLDDCRWRYLIAFDGYKDLHPWTHFLSAQLDFIWSFSFASCLRKPFFAQIFLFCVVYHFGVVSNFYNSRLKAKSTWNGWCSVLLLVMQGNVFTFLTDLYLNAMFWLTLLFWNSAYCSTLWLYCDHRTF